jgi:ribosomal protein L11 methylase PrmA
MHIAQISDKSVIRPCSAEIEEFFEGIFSTKSEEFLEGISSTGFEVVKVERPFRN